MNRIEAIDRLSRLYRMMQVGKMDENITDYLIAIQEAIYAIKREDAGGCVDCEFEETEEWELPCDRCKRNHKDYWREKAI